MQLVYLNDFYEKEEAIMKAHGISCARMQYPFSKNSLTSKIQEKHIFRGPKMKTETYLEFVAELRKNNCSVFVKSDDFKKIADALEYSKCFGKYAPKVVSFGIEEDANSIANKLISSDLKYPLFVRSDVESAAKYVGVDACTLKSADTQAITRVIAPIHTHIVNATKIIMKEIVPIKKVEGKNVEYRAIVVNGNIVCFDYEPLSGLPHPRSLSCVEQFEDCINIANKNGLGGAYFVDFGVDESDNIFVVECKNIINGTIKNINAFAEGLSQMN